MKNKIPNLNFDLFVKSYLATAAWVTADSDECKSFTREAIKTAENDCEKFIDTCIAELGESKASELLTISGHELDYIAPHDFFLTRNGHGAGFWDKEDIYGIEWSAKLTNISKQLGGCDCYHIRGGKSKLTFN